MLRDLINDFDASTWCFIAIITIWILFIVGILSVTWTASITFILLIMFCIIQLIQ